MKKILLSSIIGVLLAIADIAEGAFVVTPMEFHLEVKANESQSHAFFVRNRGDETLSLKIYTGDFWIEPDGRELFLEPGTVERSCAKWIEISPEELELLPGESKAIRFNITIPPDKTGTYWAMIFVEQTTKPTIHTAQQGQQQFNILSFQRVGVRIFEETPDAKPGSGKITQVSVTRDTKTGYPKIDLRFENFGDTLMKCKGSVEIKDMKGEPLRQIDIDEFSCYPKSVRTGQVVLSEALPPGLYTALAIVDYGAEFLVAGEAVFNVNPITGSIDVVTEASKKEALEAASTSTLPFPGRITQEGIKKVKQKKGLKDFIDTIVKSIKEFWNNLIRS